MAEESNDIRKHNGRHAIEPYSGKKEAPRVCVREANSQQREEGYEGVWGASRCLWLQYAQASLKQP